MFRCAAVGLLTMLAALAAGQTPADDTTTTTARKPMDDVRHDRVFPLANLSGYPGSRQLDSHFFLPGSDDARRRLWILAPEGEPGVQIDAVTFKPRVEFTEGPARWIDYGVVEPPRGFTQLRVSGLSADVARRSWLVVTRKLDLELGNSTIEDAERALWGMARREAGRTTVSPDRVTVGGPVRFVVRYEAGPRGLREGARVRFLIAKVFDQPQAGDPKAPGFVEVVEGGDRVEIETIRPSVEGHEKNAIICRLKAPLAAGQGFAVACSSNRSYIFPHLFRETDSPWWFAKLPPMAASVKAGDDGAYVFPTPQNSHEVRFVAGPPERLHLFLPGRRPARESLALRGVYTDHFRNIPSPTGAMDTDFNLVLVGSAGETPLRIREGRFDTAHTFELGLPPLEPGVYRAEARRPGSGELVARSNPLELLAPDSGALSIYWGEIHAHSEMSDGLGEFGEIYRHARDVGCLDFAASGDHACYYSDNEWMWMQDVTNASNLPGRFVTLIGYEWAGKQVHRNVYTSHARLRRFRGMYEPESTLDVVYDYYRGDNNVVAGPHGLLAHGVRFEHHDPDVERFLEIYSMWGSGDDYDNPLATPWGKSNQSAMSAHEMLATGALLGFTGGGDCHEGHAGFSSEDPDGQGTTPHTFAARLFFRCGLTAALAPSLTRSDLITALRKRHTYATTGARILLDFGAAGTPMGGVAPATSGPRTCQALVLAEGPVEYLEIIRSGESVHRLDAEGLLDVALEWTDETPPPEDKPLYYYLHVVQQDGHQAWSSPVWVGEPTYKESD